MSTDKIMINDLLIKAPIGVYDFEKGILQELYISVVLYTDLSISAKSDRLEDTIDYDKVEALIKKVSTNTHTELLEALAYKLIKALFKELSCDKIKIRIQKPVAVKDAKAVLVELTRSKKEFIC